MMSKVQVAAKWALAPLIYKYPPSGLQPERLATYLTGLLDRHQLSGDVAEIGCSVGGTAVLAARMLKRVGWHHRYICYDTFGGFVTEQFNSDVKKGMEGNRRKMFSDNSMGLVRKILKQHGTSEVELIKCDIARVADRDLSDSYSVVLVDVDLSDPTYVALKRFWPRIVKGGVMFVDDCPEGYGWKARIGYEKFCAEMNLAPCYEYGFGVIRKPA